MNMTTGQAAAAAAAPSGPPAAIPVTWPSGRINRVPAPGVNIGNGSRFRGYSNASTLTTGSTNVGAVTGLTPAQRCATAGTDMAKCLSVTDQIAALELQASVACTQCDQIRVQIADLRKQIAAPVATALTGAALRYGRATKTGIIQKLSSANTATVCNEKLPALMGLSPEGDVVTANYTNRVKPLIDILSKNSRPTIKALRDELKTYDPPGAFMRTFGRKAKAKSGLKAVAGSVSTALGCPAPGGLRINAPPKLPSLPAVAGIGPNIGYYGDDTMKGGGAHRRRRQTRRGRRRISRKTAKK